MTGLKAFGLRPVRDPVLTQASVKEMKLPYTIQAEWTAYLLFSIMFGPIAGYALYDAISTREVFLGHWVAFFIFGWALLWISRFRITLKPDKIQAQSLFSNRELAYAEISGLTLEIGATQPQKSAFYRLNILSRTGTEPLMINIKPYSKTDLGILVRTIINRGKGVTLDRLCQALAAEDLAPVVNEGITQFLRWLPWLFLAFLGSALLLTF